MLPLDKQLISKLSEQAFNEELDKLLLESQEKVLNYLYSYRFNYNHYLFLKKDSLNSLFDGILRDITIRDFIFNYTTRFSYYLATNDLIENSINIVKQCFSIFSYNTIIPDTIFNDIYLEKEDIDTILDSNFTVIAMFFLFMTPSSSKKEGKP